MATTRFDDWEGEYLAHFRTKGSKNGVRRYQQEDGTWTPLGLRERKAREGWGEGDERSTSRAEKKAAKAEAKAERKAARTAAVAEAKEERRKNNIKTMTDEELKAKISRMKLEQEYKELNKSPILDVGRKLITNYLDYKTKREAQAIEREKLDIERSRIKADVTKAQENTKRAKADAAKAQSEAEKVAADVKGGLKIARKTELKRAKIDWKGTTLHGGITRRINTLLTAGLSEKKKAVRVAEGKVAADKVLKDAKTKATNQTAKEATKAANKTARQAQKTANKEKRNLKKAYRQYGLSGNLN